MSQGGRESVVFIYVTLHDNTPLCAGNFLVEQEYDESDLFRLRRFHTYR